MQAALPPLIYVFAFMAVVLLVQVVFGAVFAASARNKRVNRRITMLESGMNPADVYGVLVRKSASSGGGGVRLVQLEERFGAYCQQADLRMAPRRLLLMLIAGAAGVWLISLLFLRSSTGGPFVLNATMSLLGAFMLVGFGGWSWLGRRRTIKLRKIEEQLPLALDIINRAVRAGHPVISAVQLAAQEMGDPIGTEFGLIVDETTYGLDFRDALSNFARRTGSRDASFFAISVAIQSQTGGNLAEILDGLATVIRGRNTLGKRVKALASEGKASAMLLSALPVLMIAFMLTTQPAFYTSKVGDPIFWPTVGIVMVVYFVGLLMMRRIINFKY